MGKEEKITEEVNKYVEMLSNKGYGHGLEDVEKMVRAGCIIAKHVYSEQSQWVDVRDRLPRNNNTDGTIKEVLVMDEKYHDHKGIGSYSLENGWAISGISYWKPTHWIEIPQPPTTNE